MDIRHSPLYVHEPDGQLPVTFGNAPTEQSTGQACVLQLRVSERYGHL